MTESAETAAGRDARVTTTDALKAAALLLILVDHIGHFLADDWPILRVIGRLGVPIFFFLIGFAKSRDVPFRWLVIGAVLTLVDLLWTGSLGETQINILFNFALIRLALPLVERHVLSDGLRLPLLALLFVVAMPLVNPVIEYGSEGWLFALVGLLHRRWLDEGAGWERWRDWAGLFALGVFVVVERQDYNFDWLMTACLVAGVGALAALVHDFRRADLVRQPGPGLAAAMRFCGRWSLEIYAAQIILLAAIGGLWNQFGDGDDDSETDDD